MWFFATKNEEFWEKRPKSTFFIAVLITSQSTSIFLIHILPPPEINTETAPHIVNANKNSIVNTFSLHLVQSHIHALFFAPSDNIYNAKSLKWSSRKACLLIMIFATLFSFSSFLFLRRKGKKGKRIIQVVVKSHAFLLDRMKYCKMILLRSGLEIFFVFLIFFLLFNWFIHLSSFDTSNNLKRVYIFVGFLMS